MTIPPLHRSIFGQIMLLTVVLIGVGVYFLAIQPLWDAYEIRPATVQQIAEQQALDELRLYMLPPGSQPTNLPPIEQNGVLKALAAVNPDFRYHMRIGDEAAGTGRPRYYHSRGFEQITRLKRRLNNPKICVQMEEMVTEKRGEGYLSYLYCDQLKYYEFSGVLHSVGKSSLPVYKAWVWRYSSGFLLAMFGIFLIYAAILAVNMVMIRRVARVARSFDPDDLSRKLPERGLPNEVLPLVRVANSMIVRLEEAQVRRRFFFSAAAHEMNTPLTVLRTRLEMLDEGVTKDKLVGDVRRLMDLVHRLLTLMEIEEHPALAGVVDLAACCHKVAADAAPLAAAAGVSLVLEQTSVPRHVVGDARLIAVALSNLVQNALSFSPAGTQVVVTLDDMGRVAVRDAGTGIDPATASAIFEPFVRFSTDRAGYGLGLAIVRAVATLHGGDVAAGNAVQGGAIFTIGFGPVIDDAIDR